MSKNPSLRKCDNVSWAEQNTELLTNLIWFGSIIAVLLFFYIMVFWVIFPNGSYTNYSEHVGWWI